MDYTQIHAIPMREWRCTTTTLSVIIQELGFNDNCKVVLLVGRTADDKYQVVLVDDDGKLVTTT